MSVNIDLTNEAQDDGVYSKQQFVCKNQLMHFIFCLLDIQQELFEVEVELSAIQDQLETLLQRQSEVCWDKNKKGEGKEKRRKKV